MEIRDWRVLSKTHQADSPHIITYRDLALATSPCHSALQAVWTALLGTEFRKLFLVVSVYYMHKTSSCDLLIMFFLFSFCVERKDGLKEYISVPRIVCGKQWSIIIFLAFLGGNYHVSCGAVTVHVKVDGTSFMFIQFY